MERDPHISRLMKEGALEKAPEGFQREVMGRLLAEEKPKAYVPIIGKKGRVFILLFVLLIVILTIVMTRGGFHGEAEGIFGREWQFALPQINMKLEFLSELNPSTGLAAALVAVFILVVTDTALSRRRRPG